MTWLVPRPKGYYDPSKGLLNNEHFQVSYATNDMDRACELFSTQYGITEFGGIEGETPKGGYVRIKLAWIGSTLYEIASCTGPGAELYNKILPTDKFAVRFHHLGFLVHNDADWRALLDNIASEGREILQENNNEGFMRHCYIYVPELDHHMEYIYPEQAGIDFFASMPAN